MVRKYITCSTIYLYRWNASFPPKKLVRLSCSSPRAPPSTLIPSRGVRFFPKLNFHLRSLKDIFLLLPSSAFIHGKTLEVLASYKNSMKRAFSMHALIKVWVTPIKTTDLVFICLFDEKHVFYDRQQKIFDAHRTFREWILPKEAAQ